MDRGLALLEESFPNRSPRAVAADFGTGGYLRSLAVSLVATELRCTITHAQRVVDRWVAAAVVERRARR